MNISNNELIQEMNKKLVCMEMCNKKVSAEITNDYTLPDYMPEIRRVLYVNTTILPPAKYINVSGAEFNGNIDYNILYAGSDGELHSTPLSAEYNFTIPLDTDGFDFNEAITTCFDSTFESVNIRLSGPRKLNIKCRMNAHIRLYGMLNIGTELPENINSIESLKNQTEGVKILSTTSEPLDYFDETIIPCDDFQLICANAYAFVESIINRTDEIQVNGTINYKLLYSDANTGNIERVIKRIPFSTEIDLEGISEASLTRAKGQITNVAVNIEEGKIVSELGLVIGAEAQSSEPVTYIRDIYSTEYNDKCTYRDFSIPKLGYCKNSNFSSNEKISLDSINLNNNVELIDCYGTVTTDNTECVEDKIIVSGSVKYTLITKNDEEFAAVDVILPVKYEFNNDTSNISVFDTNMNVITCKARIDDISVSIESEIELTSSGIANEKILVVDKMSLGDRIEKEKGSITVCYRGIDEDMWGLAKRYHVSVDHIETLNKISEDNHEKSYIII